MTNFEIEAFLAIAKEKNITAAAAKLYINQSSLSLRLKTLERELGCSLFIRNRGGHEVVLTPQGEKFLALALQHQSIIAQMLAVGREKKKLRVAAVNSINSTILPHVCELFLQDEPECELEVQDFDRTVEVCNYLEHNQLDIGFVGGNPAGRKVKVKPLFKEKIVLLTAKNSTFPTGVSRECLDTKKEVYIPWSVDFMKWHNEMFGDQDAPALLVSSLAQLRHFIKRPDMWTLVPVSTYYEFLSSHVEVEARDTLFEIPRRQVSMLLPAQGSYSQEIRRFYKRFIEYCEKNYGENDDIIFSK